MKRVTDKPYHTYSVYSAAAKGLYVKCPKCGKAGIVTADKTTARFSCTGCGYAKTKKQCIFFCKIENKCVHCSRYYRVALSDDKQPFPVLIAACPFCGHKMPGRVQKTPAYILYDQIKDGCEPFFGFQLWFFTCYDGKPLWALNREHLAYLIDYLSAGLREDPAGAHTTMRTQADRLPAYMKTAKNRKGVVKCLKKMQKSL